MIKTLIVMLPILASVVSAMYIGINYVNEFEVQFEIVDELSEKKSDEKEEQIDEDLSFNYDIYLDAGVL